MISARHQPVSESAISDGKLDPARQSESECLPSGNLDYDVIVAGGGTAGAAAAVAAAAAAEVAAAEAVVPAADGK